jgi:HEAT repeat protein
MGNKDGAEILKKALDDKDHHVRETAAEALAELGDDSGANVLIKMLKYTERNHPFLLANKDVQRDKSAWADLVKITVDEKVRVCGLLGSLKCKEARSVLKTLSQSKTSEIAEAASNALKEI